MASGRSGLTVLLVLLASAAPAAEITRETWRGKEVLRLTGPIDAGTPERFGWAFADVAPDAYGLPILLLDSPGGDVAAAFAMSRLMDRYPVHTVVPDGGTCASACASVLFIAGRYRTVEPTGTLGQHSCSYDGKPSQACNDALAEHAVAHGVPYGSVAAFVTYTPPGVLLTMGREEADGWGLTRYPGESESGYTRSEPLAYAFFTGSKPPAQAAWRLDFRDDGFGAFLRPVADDVSELQLNLFCDESLRGRLFLGIEIHGQAPVIGNAASALRVTTEHVSWEDTAPIVWQMDPDMTEVITEIPRDQILPFLTKADHLTITIEMRAPYKPVIAETRLATSRAVLRFAANTCPSGAQRRAPLH